ncbi:98_t:CDS:2, partial [Acaulospora colombiana]
MRMPILKIKIRDVINCCDRSVTVIKRPYSIEAISVSSNATNDSFAAYEFDFSTFYYPSVKFAAFKSQNYSAAAVAFRVDVLGLIEYNDSISFADSESFIDFYGKWSDISVTNSSGVIVLETTFVEDFSESKNENGPFNASISAYITGNVTKTKDGIILSPSSIKYSFDFQNYPYVYSNSSIAIIQAVFAESINFNNSQYFVKDNSTNTMAQYKWDSTVLADGKKANLTVEREVLLEAKGNFTVDNSGNGTDALIVELVAFDIQAIQPKSVFWDPTLGVSTPTDNLGTTTDNTTASASASLPTATATATATIKSNAARTVLH